MQEVKETPETPINDTVETETTTNDTVEVEGVEVMFLDPSPVTTYDAGAYEIDLVHSFTLGDILIATLISMLIIVVLLSRLLGGRR